MKVINLWGEPGAGKSTVAAGLFYKMKAAGYKVELVTEYAKDVVWDSHYEKLKDQLYLLAKQNRRLERLRDKVDWVITDSPLLLVLAYIPEVYYKNFNRLTYDVWNSYTNVSFLLQRNHSYQSEGRYQNETEANQLGQDIQQILQDYNEAYLPVCTADAVDVIFNAVNNNDI